MKTKYLLILFMGVILLVNACSPLAIVSSSGEQPTPVEISDPASTGYQPVTVDDVKVEVGVGSPIPVHAIVSASLPNACAQLGEVRVHRDGTTFVVRLVAYVPAQMDCNPDTLPFRLEVPLNIVNLPEGPYQVNVNGVTASFDPRTMPVDSGETIAERNLIPVEHVGFEVGLDSVQVVASGTWPDPCAQIVEVQSQLGGYQIDFTVLARAVDSCPPDQPVLPFRFAIPLNGSGLQDGTYTITVNGVSNTFDWPPSR